MTKRDDVRMEIEALRGKLPPIGETEEQHGAINGTMNSGPKILFVDDHWDVVSHLVKLEEKHAKSPSDLRGQFVFFRVSDVPGASFEDFYVWLDAQPLFDAIYVDGDLGPQGDGNMICTQLRQKDRYRYQPLALITADESFFKKQKTKHHGLRILGKFDTQSENVINRLIIEHEDVRRQTEQQIWTDCQTALSKKLDQGVDTIDAVKQFGASLRQHLGICAWYLREMQGNKLVAIASDDWEFKATDELDRKDTPVFLLDLFDGQSDDPWHVHNNIKPDQATGRDNMVGYHAIAASLGGRLLGDFSAVFTAYRRPEDPPFHESDAMRLHHAAILFRLAMAPERTNKRLTALSDTTKKMLDADETGKIAALLCDFLHVQIQIPLENQRKKVKTTARLFLRGSGELKRWGDDFRVTRNSIPPKETVPKITINDDCVYKRAVVDAKTKADWMASEKGENVTQTGTLKVESYLTVPLLYDGAVLGAVNLECDTPNAYQTMDMALVEAIARVAAAAILNLRIRRFMDRLADLTVRAIDPSDLPQNRTDQLLEDGSTLLYELVGYSDMLMFEEKEGPEPAWQIIKAWKGAGARPALRKPSEWRLTQQKIDENWKETYLYQCLNDPDVDHFSFVKKNSGLPDNGDGLLRPKDRPTWCHFASFVGPTNARTRALELLFEHPHPVPEHFRAVMAAYARFIHMVYESSEANASLGAKLSTARIEARAGKVFSQFRHNAIHLLRNIYDDLDLPDFPDDPYRTIELAKDGLRIAEKEMDRARVLLRPPHSHDFDLREIWNELVANSTKRALQLRIRIHTAGSPIKLNSDANMSRFILQNLLDNALEHGAVNGVTEITLSANDNSWWVCDNGTEIVQDVREKLFELGTTTKSQASGSALFMSHELADELNAELSYERRNDRNCFVLRFRPPAN